MSDVDNATTLPAFNPSADERVSHIKERTEELIKYMRVQMASGIIDPRCAALAVTNYEQAAMWAVKSLFVGR